VARIEKLATKIAQARGLRADAEEEANLLLPRAAARAFPDGQWQEIPLGELLSENSLNGLSTRPSDTPPGLPILRISAGTSRADAIVDEADHKYLVVTEQDGARYRLEPGDLLACRFNGNLHYVGRFALYQGYSGQHQVYPDKLIRFRVDRKKALPEYVRLAMNSPRTRQSIEARAATTAGNIGISGGSLKEVCIPVPPVAEQRRLIDYLDGLQAKVDAVRRLQAETAAELDALLPAVLDRAFKGEL
jgi:type I restriction enzyme, S subunit